MCWWEDCAHHGKQVPIIQKSVQLNVVSRRKSLHSNFRDDGTCRAIDVGNDLLQICDHEDRSRGSSNLDDRSRRCRDLDYELQRESLEVRDLEYKVHVSGDLQHKSQQDNDIEGSDSTAPRNGINVDTYDIICRSCIICGLHRSCIICGLCAGRNCVQHCRLKGADSIDFKYSFNSCVTLDAELCSKNLHVQRKGVNNLSLASCSCIGNDIIESDVLESDVLEADVLESDVLESDVLEPFYSQSCEVTNKVSHTNSGGRTDCGRLNISHVINEKSGSNSGRISQYDCDEDSSDQRPSETHRDIGQRPSETHRGSGQRPSETVNCNNISSCNKCNSQLATNLKHGDCGHKPEVQYSRTVELQTTTSSYSSWNFLERKRAITTLLVALLLVAASANPLTSSNRQRNTLIYKPELRNVPVSQNVPNNFAQVIEGSTRPTGTSNSLHWASSKSKSPSDGDYDSFIVSSTKGPPTNPSNKFSAKVEPIRPTQSTASSRRLSDRTDVLILKDSHYAHNSIDGVHDTDNSIGGVHATDNSRLVETSHYFSRRPDNSKRIENIKTEEAIDISSENDQDQVSDAFDDAIRTPPTPEEHSRIQRFDPSRINYTAVRLLIDDELRVQTNRRGRFFGYSSYAYRLPSFLNNLGRMFDIETVINEVETSIMTSVSCNACKGGVGLLQHYIEQGNSKEDIVNAASKLCSSFNVETPRVCYGIINLMSEEVIYVMQNLVMEPNGVCGFLIGDVCGLPPDPYHRWRILFPPYPKPPVQLIKPPKEDLPTLKVLHISDTHFDPYYLEGSNAECNEPMCCRKTSGVPASASARAGKWGDYRKCDTPTRTIHSMFENIAHKHKDVDYILWTGDLPPHDIWNQTRDSNLKVLHQTVQQLLDYFPNTPVFPSLGNHESAPVNSFPPPSIAAKHSVQWLYDELESQWRKWLPAYTSATILKGAYYAVQVMPGFRIISLNMNYCNNKNWWLLLDSEDPTDQLQWLVYELQASELRKEKVHIIGHIPPGYHDCLKVWSENFYAIVNRYESTITGQFYGHTHYDEFEIFYDIYNGTYRPLNVAYVTPSITTWDRLNPGFRFYHIQSGPKGEYRVIDHETWVMNLDEANHPSNSNRSPRWYPLYSARRAYGMRSLLPVDWDNLVYRMVDDEALFDKFYRHYWKNSPKREACDSECKKRILCDLKSGRSNDRKKTCAIVHERVEAQERSQWRNWLYSGITVTSLATLFLWW